MLAEKRQCIEEGAPAIMSCLGMTDWYHAQIRSFGQADGQQDLVLGKYSLDFIREAAFKIGPLFFGTYCDRDIDHVGSMLPFNRRLGNERSGMTNPGPRKDADGYEWQVQQSGDVRHQTGSNPCVESVWLAVHVRSERPCTYSRYGS